MTAVEDGDSRRIEAPLEDPILRRFFREIQLKKSPRESVRLQRSSSALLVFYRTKFYYEIHS